MQIIPSILVTSEEDFKNQIASIANTVDMVQIDLADGEFIPNTTWPYQDPEHAQKYLNEIDFELHLMVKNPLMVIKKWLGHPRFKRALVHYESTDDIKPVLEEIKALGKRVGLVLNPDTSIYDAEPYFDTVDLVMLMGVTPGFQGQKFIEKTIERIGKIKEINKNIFVEVDGGVSKDTIKKISEAGADAVCPGSAIFGNKQTPAKNIKEIQKIVEKLNN